METRDPPNMGTSIHGINKHPVVSSMITACHLTLKMEAPWFSETVASLHGCPNPEDSNLKRKVILVLN
jgi:hypothetical protein